MKQAPQVLMLIDWFWPSYKAGGPVRSLSNLVEMLSGEAQITVLTGKQDIDGTPVAESYAGYEGAQVHYVSRPQASFIRKWKALNPGGVVYINGIYSLTFSIWPLILCRFLLPKTPIIIAPRGMLNSGALQIKAFKKRLFLKVFKLLGLYKGVIWHATSEEEKKRILSIFPNAKPPKVISNVPVKPQKAFGFRPQKGAPLHTLFTVTRVVPIKKLEILFEGMQQTKLQHKWVWDIYGPVEDLAYCNMLKEKAKKNMQLNIVFKGACPPYSLSDIASQYRAFCLPSANENFGHAIFEALAMGKPVLISDQTPWTHLENQGIGFDISLETPSLFIEKLNYLGSLDADTLQAYEQRAFAFATLYYENNTWKTDYLTLFSSHEK